MRSRSLTAAHKVKRRSNLHTFHTRARFRLCSSRGKREVRQTGGESNLLGQRSPEQAHDDRSSTHQAEVNRLSQEQSRRIASPSSGASPRRVPLRASFPSQSDVRAISLTAPSLLGEGGECVWGRRGFSGLSHEDVAVGVAAVQGVGGMTGHVSATHLCDPCLRLTLQVMTLIMPRTQ